MRLIDLDAFREEYDLREHCEDCGRRNKKSCDYPSYSARDFCGWLDDAPTVDAVPLDKLCDWLAENASLPVGEYMISAMAWRRKLKKWMEEHNATDTE